MPAQSLLNKMLNSVLLFYWHSMVAEHEILRYLEM